MLKAPAVAGVLTSTGLPGLGSRALAVAALLAAATVTWLIARRRAGSFRPIRERAAPGNVPPRASYLTAEDLRGPLGEHATFVQFSTSTCATCPHVSRVLGHVAGAEHGVVHIEVDAEARIDLVRRLGIVRTPTVLLLGPHGQLHSRTSGPLTAAQAVAALHHLPNPTSRSARA